MNKVVLSLIFTGMAFAFSMCGCSSKKAESASQESVQKVQTTVAVKSVQKVSLDDYIEFGGTVRAVNSVAVLPSVAGKIAQILVETGERVSKNQIIAQVDASKPGADYTMSPVRASAAGTVVSIPVSLGSYVTSSSTVAEIASVDDLEIKVNVSERFVPLVKIGQTGEISFKSYPDETFEAKITKLSPVLDAATRTQEVTLKLTETKNIVKAGMFAHVKLVTNHKENIVTVPAKAIVYNAGKPYVFTATNEDGTAKVFRTAVQTGISVDGVTEIVEGLKEGDSVVIKGQNMISDGQKVNIAGQ
ncbi:efflux RND transporter periplasmic adaptor subunit [Treponema sp.]|uniref:efflux RND transporter periplasmic adaptor subunit n=1 Tax=Treponema sp. TaxID=166 RepID=UPI00388EA7FE